MLFVPLESKATKMGDPSFKGDLIITDINTEFDLS